MSEELNGRRIAFLVANSGVEQVELTEPWDALRKAGAETVLLAPSADDVQAVNHDIEKGDTFTPDGTVGDADPDQFDALVLPGGVANPDFLRVDDDVRSFVRSFFEKGKPVGAICHGPWSLIDAGVVDGLTLTSWPSLKTDLENAGAKWVDEEVHVDRGLTTSRNPDDLPAFCSKIVEEFCEGVHEELAQATK